MIRLILATEDYSPSHKSSIMTAKLFSMKTGIPLEIADSGWLLKMGIRPYVPTFLSESEDGSVTVIRAGCSLDHWRALSQLESALDSSKIT